MTRLIKLLAVGAVGLSTLVPSMALAYDRAPRGRVEVRHERWERRGQMYREGRFDRDGRRFHERFGR
jgi:hypothetical protein